MGDLDVSMLMSVAEATAVIDAADLPAARVASVPLAAALGRVLAEGVAADRDYPPFDRSMMDGYAARSADGEAARRVVGEVSAGRTFDRALEPGEAVAIMTGAPLPAGADAVVPVEQSQAGGDRTVRFLTPVAAGACVARRGGEVAAGTRLLEPGRPIGPAEIAVAATVGRAELPVYARPRVAILSTGDEIVPPGMPLASPAHVRDANGPMLAALLARLGGEVVATERCRDDVEALRGSIAGLLASAEVLVVSGGASMGRYDFVPPLLKESGFDLRVTKLRIRPGKPFVFGVRPGDGRFAFGLPGNPVSAFACTLRLAARLLRRMQGLPAGAAWVEAPLAEALPTENGPREFYQPAVWSGSAVRPLKWIGSADVFTLAKANALLVRPEGDPPRPAGATVRLLEIPR